MLLHDSLSLRSVPFVFRLVFDNLVVWAVTWYHFMLSPRVEIDQEERLLGKPKEII